MSSQKTRLSRTELPVYKANHYSADENAWRFLFDIALSHGESLRQQLLTYNAFIAFVQSSEIVGPSTGVYMVLLEELWRRHSTRFVANKSQDASSSPAPLFEMELMPDHSDTNRAVEDFKKAASLGGVIHFDGFTDIMNVVSLRCYQTRRCADLYYGESFALRDAIVRTKEDSVQLRDAIDYTAHQYLKQFISRCTIHKRTVVTADPAVNGWLPLTNRIVAHAIGELMEPVILPLFERYAAAGRMAQSQYESFVHDVFPRFNSIQLASAKAVFTHGNVVSPAGATQEQGGSSPSSSAPSMNLDGFVNALLMLGVVAYSDEEQYRHHRPVTAKLWSVFEEHLCPAAGVDAAACLSDPLLTLRYSSIRPLVTRVFPSPLCIDRERAFFLEGYNLAVAPAEEPQTAVGETERKSIPQHSSSPASAAAPADVPAASENDEHGAASSCGSASAPAAAPVPDTASVAAAQAFANAAPLGDAGSYGCCPCSVVMDDSTPAVSRFCSSSQLEVTLPGAFTNVASQYSCHVRAQGGRRDGAAGPEEVAVLTLTPCRRVSVRLRTEDGTGRCSPPVSLLLTTNSMTQLIPAKLLASLRAFFDAEAKVPENGAAGGDSASGAPALSFDAFCTVCRRLGLVRSATATVVCRACLATMRETRRITACGNDAKENEGDGAGANAPAPVAEEEEATLPFDDFLCALATLSVRTAGSVADLPNITNFLGAAVAQAVGSTGPSPTDGAGGGVQVSARGLRISGRGGGASGPQRERSQIPYNATIDVPFEDALNRRDRTAAAPEVRQEMATDAVLTAANSARSRGVVSPSEGVSARSLMPGNTIADAAAPDAAVPRLLPAFPTDLDDGVVAVSQYGGDAREGLLESLAAAALRLENEFLRKEVTIPERQLSPDF